MTKRQLNLIQHSWPVIQPLMHKLGNSFSKKLYQAYPQVVEITRPGTGIQPNKLVYLFCTVVAQLNNLDAVTEEVKELSFFHQKYNVPPGAYVMMGNCMLNTWEEKFGDGWSEELRNAWLLGYQLLTNTLVTLQQPV